jgi:hypothetical protein
MTTIAAIVQLLIAAGFLSMPAIRARYGAASQAAAQAELERQGAPGSLLDDINFGGKGIETAIPAAVAAVMIALAGLNFADTQLGLVLTWIVQPLILLGNAAILYSQLTAAKSLRVWLDRKNDPALQQVDVRALLDAAGSVYPRWVIPTLQNIRHTVVFGGSVLVLIATIIAA